MPLITPQTAPLPSGGPDSLLTTRPPGALLMMGTNGLELTATCSVGTVTLTPYFWNNTAWYPLGDNVATPKSLTVAVAGIASGLGRFVRPAEPRYWALVSTGGGTLTNCQLSEGVF